MMKHPLNPWFEIAFLVFMQTITFGISVYCFGYFVVHWMEEFSTGRGDLLLASGLSSVTLAVMSPFAGQVVDRYDKRKLILGGAVVFSLSLVAVSMASNHWQIVFIYAALVPIAQVFCGALMSMALASQNPIERKGLAMGIVGAGVSLGGLVIAPVVVYLLADQGWREVHRYLAVLVILAIFIPALFFVRSAPQQAKSLGQKQSGVVTWFNSTPVVCLGFALLLPGFAYMAILHNLAAMALDLGISQQQAASITATLTLIMVFGRIGVGWLLDRMSANLIYFLLMILLATGLSVTALSNGYLALLAGVCCTGLVVAGRTPLVSTLIHRHWGSRVFGSVIGVVYFIGAFGPMGSTVLGYARDTTGSYSVAILALLVLVPIAGAAYYTFSRTAPVLESE